MPLKAEEKTSEIYLSLSNYDINKSLQPVNSIFYDKKEIEDTKKNDLGYVIDEIPSAYVRRLGGSEGTALPSMRGFYAKQVSVLIDGIKVPKDPTGSIDLSLLPISNVSGLEVLKGGWSSLYGGNSEGGVINIFTKNLPKNSQIAEISAEHSSFSTRVYEVKSGFNKEGFEIFTGGRSYYSEGFQENSHALRNSFDGKISYKDENYGKLTLTGYAIKAERGIPSGTPVDISDFDGDKEKAANTPFDKQYDDNYFLNLNYELEKGENKFFASYGRSLYQLKAHQYNSWTGFFDDTENKTISNTSVLKYFVKGYVLGFEYEQNYLKSSFYDNHKMENYGYFVNKSYSINDKLALMPSIRLDDNRTFDSVFSPKLLVNYLASESLSFSAQIGKSWQAPTFADLYNPWAPNPDLKPEKSIQTEFSVKYTNKNGFYAISSFYYSDIKDRIALDPTRSWAAYNIDKAFNSGIDTELGYSFNNLEINAGLNVINAKGKTEGEGSYKKLAYIPEYKFNSALKYKSDLISAVLKMESISTQYSGKDKTGKKIPAYSVYDLILSKKIKALEIYAGIENIFDEHYAINADSFNGYYPANPRTYKCGIKMKF
jgi:vitamin B12 transporter